MDTVLETFFDTDFLGNYAKDKAVELEDSQFLVTKLREILECEEADKILERNIAAMFTRPEGMMLMMAGFSAETLKPMVRPFMVDMDKEIAPMVRAICQHAALGPGSRRTCSARARVCVCMRACACVRAFPAHPPPAPPSQRGRTPLSHAVLVAGKLTPCDGAAVPPCDRVPPCRRATLQLTSSFDPRTMINASAMRDQVKELMATKLEMLTAPMVKDVRPCVCQRSSCPPGASRTKRAARAAIPSSIECRSLGWCWLG